MKNEVFRLRDGWRICFNGRVAAATWQERGPALAQLELLEKGYSIIQKDGVIKHVGKENQ